MALTSKFDFKITATLTKGGVDLSTPTDQLNIARALSWTSGTGANQADVEFHDSRTLAASASETLDLVDGTLLDVYGAAFTPSRVKAIYIRNTSANAATTLLIGQAAPANLAVQNTIIGVIAVTGPKDGGSFQLRKDEVYMKVAPDATAHVVTSATVGAEIKITNQDGTNAAAYDVVIVGASA